MKSVCAWVRACVLPDRAMPLSLSSYSPLPGMSMGLLWPLERRGEEELESGSQPENLSKIPVLSIQAPCHHNSYQPNKPISGLAEKNHNTTHSLAEPGKTTSTAGPLLVPRCPCAVGSVVSGTADDVIYGEITAGFT